MNIIEKLSEFKKGMKLYSPQLGELTFDGIVDDRIITKSSWNAFFQFDANCKCYLGDGSVAILMPSKINSDWNMIRERKKVGEYYYYITAFGNILSSIESNCNTDAAMFECGNYFLTEEDASNSKLYHAYNRKIS